MPAEGPPGGGCRPHSPPLRSRLFWKLRAGPAAPRLNSRPHPGSPAPPRGGPGRAAHQWLLGRERHLANQRPAPPPGLSARPAPQSAGGGSRPALLSVCLASRLRAARFPPSEVASSTGYGTPARPPPSRYRSGPFPPSLCAGLAPPPHRPAGGPASSTLRRLCQDPAPTPVCAGLVRLLWATRHESLLGHVGDALQQLIGCGGGGANVARAVRGWGPSSSRCHGNRAHGDACAVGIRVCHRDVVYCRGGCAIGMGA